MWNLERTICSQFKVTCEHRRISGCRFSRYFSGGEKRRPEIHLHSQAKFTERRYVVKERYTSVKLELSYVSCFLAFFLCRVPVLSVEVPCFFSLLREIFSNFSDSKANLQKVCSLCCTEIVVCALYIYHTTVITIIAFLNRTFCLCVCL